MSAVIAEVLLLLQDQRRQHAPTPTPWVDTEIEMGQARGVSKKVSRPGTITDAVERALHACRTSAHVSACANLGFGTITGLPQITQLQCWNWFENDC